MIESSLKVWRKNYSSGALCNIAAAIDEKHILQKCRFEQTPLNLMQRRSTP
jgi:hypothetical protein